MTTTGLAVVHLKIKQGLDIPIKGKPQGGIRELPKPKEVALDLSPFDDTKFRLLAKKGDHVKIGTPITDDKSCFGRFFVSPASGQVKEVVRGLKRRILSVIIECDPKDEYENFGKTNVANSSRENLIEILKKTGLFTHIRRRPFNILADPKDAPRAIFVKAIETAPFMPSAELQVEGFEKEFQEGLNALVKLTTGKVHLTYHANCSCSAFKNAQGVERHTAEGPHPVGNTSVHIHNICPITSPEDCIWTVSAHDVVCIGQVLLNGRYHNQRVISIAGPGILPESRGYYRACTGHPVSELIVGRTVGGWQRFISGDVLTGETVKTEGHLGFQHYAFCVFPENADREFAHFFGLGLQKYSFHRAYASGFTKDSGQEFSFTTNQHGEARAFVDGTIYNKVMPMRIPTMHLIKAVISEDFETAETLGLLEVDSEDFALPTFIDPCKIEMVEIMKHALKRYAKEVLE